MAGEQLDQGVVTERIAPPPAPADQEHERAGRLPRPLVHHVPADRLQRPWFVQVDDPLSTRLAPRPMWVVITLADRDPPPSVGDVLQMQRQHLTRTEPAIQHEQEHRQVPQPL